MEDSEKYFVSRLCFWASEELKKLHIALCSIPNGVPDFLRMAKIAPLNQTGSRKGIEMLVDLNIAYCALRLLPYQDETFSEYQNESTRELRHSLNVSDRRYFLLV